MVRIDVVMQYGGFQDVQGLVRVCEVVRADGSVGVGVYVSFSGSLAALGRL
jgi:hypothetical protein